MTLPPMRSVVSWLTPDPRHPFFKDLKLTCGHTLAHRKLVKGRDGRYHVPRQARCPCCHAVPAVHALQPARRASPPAAAMAVHEQTTVNTPAPVVVAVAAASMTESSTYAWSARDRAARNWD